MYVRVCLAFQGNEEVISLLVAANIKDSDAITVENGAKKRASQIARWKGFASAAASIERFFFFFYSIPFPHSIESSILQRIIVTTKRAVNVRTLTFLFLRPEYQSPVEWSFIHLRLP